MLGSTLLSIGVLVGPSGAQVDAQPEGRWSQFQGGPDHAGNALDGPPPGYAEIWSLDAPLGGPGDRSGLSAPVIAGGLVVSVGPDEVIAVEASSGVERWRIDRREGPPIQPAVSGEGPDAVVVFPEGYGPNPPTGDASTVTSTTPSPSAGGDGGDDATSGVELVAVALADGTEVWRTPLESPSRSGVTAAGDAVYVGANDGTVTALDAASGSIRWSEPAGGEVLRPVAVVDDLVVATSLGDLDAVLAVIALRDDDGSEAWRYEPPVPVTLGSAPAVGAGSVIVGLADRTVRAIDLATGAPRWSARLNAEVSLFAAPAIAEDDVIALDVAGQVYRLDGATGERIWDHALNAAVLWSSPVITGSHVLVATNRGELFALELGTGDLVWQADLADGLVRTLAVTSDLLVAVRSGSAPGLVGLEHDPEAPLTRIVTPTAFDPGAQARSFAMAAIPLIAIALVLGRVLSRRLGPAELGAERAIDPIEDALGDPGNTR